MKIIPIAGPKLREQAAERTRAHIQQQSKGRTDLTRWLKSSSDRMKVGTYLSDEHARLERIEGLTNGNRGAL